MRYGTDHNRYSYENTFGKVMGEAGWRMHGII